MCQAGHCLPADLRVVLALRHVLDLKETDAGRAIAARADLRPVLHGTSSTPDGRVCAAVRIGAAKVATELQDAWLRGPTAVGPWRREPRRLGGRRCACPLAAAAAAMSWRALRGRGGIPAGAAPDGKRAWPPAP